MCSKKQSDVSVLRRLPLIFLMPLLMVACDRQQAQQAPPVPEVTVVTVAEEPISLTSELPGRTSAYRVAEVRPQVSGIILHRNFEEGAKVRPVRSFMRSIRPRFRRRMRAP